MPTRLLLIALLSTLAACASDPARQSAPSPCAVSEASMECQVERYNNVNVP